MQMLYYIISPSGERIATPSAPARGAAKRLFRTLSCCLAAVVLSSRPAAAGLEVVASIQPLHSLVAGVMEGVGEPTLLIKGAGSPHGHGLRPSDARALERADLVFWIGAELESFLSPTLHALVDPERVVGFTARSHEVRLLPQRRAGAWEADAHSDGDHVEAAGIDPHIWLDPDNAVAIARIAAQALSAVDPANGKRYRANAARVAARIEALDREIAAALAPVRAVPYAVFHDGYRYFEAHYVLNPVGSVSVSPEQPPGAKRLSQIRNKIKDLGVRCVFSEPQFNPALVDTLVAGTSARSGQLDPLGARLEPGPAAYFTMMRGLARSLLGCLSDPS